MLDSMAGDPAYIVNLGHGLAPDIPEAHVKAFVAAVKSWEPRP
jgi:uroporphyrinogen-III decarboxylase